MTKVLTYSKLAMKFAKGICGLRKKEYDLQFVYEPDDNLWYIDMPWAAQQRSLCSPISPVVTALLSEGSL